MLRFRDSLFILQRRLISRQCSICNKEVKYPMPPQPILSDVESGWYSWWKDHNFFRKTNSKEKFVMLLPPPNVTGKLHMGHAVTCAIQDAFIRWNQLNGKHAVWIPGCDHAGIATQIVVEKHLWEERRLTRHDLGRERFIDEVKKWKTEKGNIIFHQMEKMGVSLDWDRSFFTLDEKIARGVIESFTRLFEAGFVYRGNKMVNWCSTLQSAISDFEVEKMDISDPVDMKVPGHDKPISFGYLYDVKYRLVDSGETITVCTTRPETVLGDTALMVHPEDSRYVNLKGKKVVHPLRGDSIPIVEDTSVARDFGSGIVKVTPGHSFQDYEVATRHNLPVIEILDDNGWILPTGSVKNQPRFDAREEVLDKLANMGLLGHKKPHSLHLPICMRSGDVIEPRLKVQWFLSTKEMTEKARDVVKEGSLRFHPPHHSIIWDNFLSERRDWCVSRQLWWGHRIPVFWVSVRSNSQFGSQEEIACKDSVFVAASDKKEALRKGSQALRVAKKAIATLKQEQDVLDTWFSSSVLPFVTVGWPDETTDFRSLFPLSLMETGHDILFFWVARMVMISLTLTKSLPFNDVLLHGILTDSEGKKMSKSKGNVLDPIDVIDGSAYDNNSSGVSYEAFGADALRFSLCSLDIKRHRLTLDIRNVQQEHFFRNKIWQTFRFLMSHHQAIPESSSVLSHLNGKKVENVMDKWILSQLTHTIIQTHEGYRSFNVHTGANSLKNFWITCLCDVYLEAVKPRLWNHESCPNDALQCLQVLWNCCYVSLQLLSPLMPFLSETLYQYLPTFEPKNTSIMECSAPKSEQWIHFRNAKIEEDVEVLLKTVSCLRNLRKTYNINSKKQQGTGVLLIQDDSIRETANEINAELKRLCYLSDLSILSPQLSQTGHRTDIGNQGSAVIHPVAPGITVLLELKGLIDPVKEVERLNRKISKLERIKGPLDQKILRLRSTNRQPLPGLVEKVEELEGEVRTVNEILNNIRKIYPS